MQPVTSSVCGGQRSKSSTTWLCGRFKTASLFTADALTDRPNLGQMCLPLLLSSCGLFSTPGQATKQWMNELYYYRLQSIVPVCSLDENRSPVDGHMRWATTKNPTTRSSWFIRSTNRCPWWDKWHTPRRWSPHPHLFSLRSPPTQKYNNAVNNCIGPLLFTPLSTRPQLGPPHTWPDKFILRNLQQELSGLTWSNLPDRQTWKLDR